MKLYWIVAQEEHANAQNIEYSYSEYTYDVCSVKLNKYEAYNLTKEGSITLATAMDEWSKNNQGDFPMTVVGYEVVGYPNLHNSTLQTATYFFLDDGRVLFASAITLLRNFFDIISKFGTPSENGGLKLSVKMAKNKDKSYYIVKIHGVGNE
ncbi:MULTISPECIES: hypothetical protein [unclassified Bartonella]|uniref:hypothetical protein n=1 Tax=unclassified Bartonella TaxID=2645622 RepID=UPI002362F7CF|nr:MULTISPECIES: hypothetical protein [unclassified Bartonella]